MSLRGVLAHVVVYCRTLLSCHCLLGIALDHTNIPSSDLNLAVMILGDTGFHSMQAFMALCVAIIVTPCVCVRACVRACVRVCAWSSSSSIMCSPVPSGLGSGPSGLAETQQLDVVFLHFMCHLSRLPSLVHGPHIPAAYSGVSFGGKKMIYWRSDFPRVFIRSRHVALQGGIIVMWL